MRSRRVNVHISVKTEMAIDWMDQRNPGGFNRSKFYNRKIVEFAKELGWIDPLPDIEKPEEVVRGVPCGPVQKKMYCESEPESETDSDDTI